MRLDPLFRPESIAVIGASDKPTPGRRIIASLERIGFAGRIFPVNPNYPSVLNRPTGQRDRLARVRFLVLPAWW